MTDLAPVGFGGVVSVALLTSSVFLVAMWRRRTEPLARPLLGVAAVSVLSVLVQFALVEDLLRKTGTEVWILSVYTASLPVLGLWVYFTFQYTGRGRQVTVSIAGAIGAMVGVTLLTVVFAPQIWPGRGNELVNAVTAVSTLLVQALTVVSVFTLLDETMRAPGYLYREALAHAGGVLLFGAAPFVASIYREPVAFPVVVTLSSLLFLVSITRYALFETLPVARVAGRDRVFNEIADPVIVVDRKATVKDLNPAAGACFGLDRSAAVGRPLGEAVQGPTDPELIAETGAPVHVEMADGRTLSVTADRVTDSRDRLFGYLLLYRDVTDRRDRERRLGVLNQLLVGAVRDRMEGVAATAATLTQGNGGRHEPESVGEEVWQTTTELTELVTRAREVERALTTDGAGESELVEAVRTAAADDAVASLDLPDDGSRVAVRRSLLDTVLGLTLGDVFPGTPVEAAVTAEGDSPTVRVSPAGGPPDDTGRSRPRGGPDGPTGPVDEFAVELAGVAVEHAGGSLTVLDSEYRGRSVVVRFPSADSSCESATGNTGTDQAETDRLEGVQ